LKCVGRCGGLLRSAQPGATLRSPPHRPTHAPSFTILTSAMGALLVRQRQADREHLILRQYDSDPDCRAAQHIAEHTAHRLKIDFHLPSPHVVLSVQRQLVSAYYLHFSVRPQRVLATRQVRCPFCAEVKDRVLAHHRYLPTKLSGAVIFKLRVRPARPWGRRRLLRTWRPAQRVEQSNLLCFSRLYQPVLIMTHGPICDGR